MLLETYFTKLADLFEYYNRLFGNDGWYLINTDNNIQTIYIF